MNNLLFGIVTRHSHTHGRRVMKAVKRDEIARARWYGNYGMCRYGRRLSAVFATGGISERHHFDLVINQRRALDILEQRRFRRMLKPRM